MSGKMKKKGLDGLDKLLEEMARDLNFDFWTSYGEDGEYHVEAGYWDQDEYIITFSLRLHGGQAIRYVTRKVIRYLIEDMARN